MKTVKKILLIILVVFLIACGGFYFWASDYYKPMNESIRCMNSDSKVFVEDDKHLNICREYCRFY